MIQSAQASFKHWLWPVLSDQYHLSSPERFRYFDSRLDLSVNYEHWRELNTQDESQNLFAKSQTMRLLQHFVESEDSPELKLSFALQVGTELTQFAWKTDFWQVKFQEEKESTALSIQIAQQHFALGLIAGHEQYGTVWQFKPVQGVNFFYKRLTLDQNGSVSAEFNKELASNAWLGDVRADYRLASNWQQRSELTGFGVQLVQPQFSLYAQSLGDKSRFIETNSMKFSFRFSEAWQLKGNYRYQNDPSPSSLIYVNQTAQGIWSHQFQLEQTQLSLHYQKNPIWYALVYLRQAETQTQTKGLTRALFDPDGLAIPFLWLFDFDTRVKLQSAGVEVASKSRQGLGYLSHLSWARLEPQGEGVNVINAQLYGFFDRREMTTRWRWLDALLLKFGLMYRGKNWQLNYQVAQIVPVKWVEKRGTESEIDDLDDENPSDSTNPSDGSGESTDSSGSSSVEDIAANSSSNVSSKDWRDWFEKWPSGHVQTLEFNYFF